MNLVLESLERKFTSGLRKTLTSSQRTDFKPYHEDNTTKNNHFNTKTKEPIILTLLRDTSISKIATEDETFAISRKEKFTLSVTSKNLVTRKSLVTSKNLVTRKSLVTSKNLVTSRIEFRHMQEVGHKQN